MSILVPTARSCYEDEGDSYNYEKGAYSTIPFTWNDKSRTLTIGERKGFFIGMWATRQFTLVLPDGSTKVVSYDGSTLAVTLR